MFNLLVERDPTNGARKKTRRFYPEIILREKLRGWQTTTLGTFQADASWAGIETTQGGTPGATWGVLGPWFAAVAATGVIVAAMYLLYMVGRMCFGPLVEPAGHHDHHEDGHAHLPTDLTAREIGVLLPLAAACLYLGLQPTPLMKSIEGPIRQTVRLVQSNSGIEGATMVPVQHAEPGGHDAAEEPADAHGAEAEPPADGEEAPAHGEEVAE